DVVVVTVARCVHLLGNVGSLANDGVLATPVVPEDCLSRAAVVWLDAGDSARVEMDLTGLLVELEEPAHGYLPGYWRRNQRRGAGLWRITASMARRRRASVSSRSARLDSRRSSSALRWALPSCIRMVSRCRYSIMVSTSASLSRL